MTSGPTKTETVEVKVPTYVPLDKRLTRVAAEPKLPAGDVVDEDLADLIEKLQAWGRGLAKQVNEIAGLQPSGEP